MEVSQDAGSELTCQQRQSLEDFFQQCEQSGLLHRPQELQPEDVIDGLNDETTLLRFLKGRQFEADGALKQYKEALTIRQHVRAIASYQGIDIGEFEAARSLYPHWTGRRTKKGLPICMFDLAHLTPAITSDYAKSRSVSHKPDGKHAASESTKRAIVSLDYLTRFVLPLCSDIDDRPDPAKPITSAVFLVDVGTLSLKQGWSLKSYVQDVSKLLATCYPEVVDRVYALNASTYFGTIWGFLSKWIDPKTASKLVIVPQSKIDATLDVDIDRESIPVQFGGNCEFEHGMSPKLDGPLMKALDDWSLSHNELPLGPIKWTMNDDGKRAAVAVGHDGTEMRKDTVATSRRL